VRLLVGVVAVETVRVVRHRDISLQKRHSFF
jgi:hypothetical protein